MPWKTLLSCGVCQRVMIWHQFPSAKEFAKRMARTVGVVNRE